MADLPGLIDGASEGVGLGHKFLRHALRTKVLAHVIDMGASEGRSPIQDYLTIRKEIEKYSEKLALKREIIIANKMDLEDAKKNLEEFKKKFPDKEIILISAITNQGMDNLMDRLASILEEVEDDPLYQDSELESHVIYKFKQEKPFTITKEADARIIEGKEIEKLFKMTRFNEDDAVLRFARKLKGMGVEEELERLGALKGDTVVICDYAFVFKE